MTLNSAFKGYCLGTHPGQAQGMHSESTGVKSWTGQVSSGLGHWPAGVTSCWQLLSGPHSPHLHSKGENSTHLAGCHEAGTGHELSDTGSDYVLLFLRGDKPAVRSVTGAVTGEADKPHREGWTPGWRTCRWLWEHLPHPMDRQMDTTAELHPAPLLTSQNTHDGGSSPLTGPQMRPAGGEAAAHTHRGAGGIRTQTQV